MVNNTKKIRRSKSRYGRTRRQRRKQRRMRGGFAFGDLINVFKPKTQEQKCEEAQQEAEEICNNSETPLDQEQSFSPSMNDTTSSPPISPSTSPLDDIPPSLPLNDEYSSPPLGQQQQQQQQLDQQLPSIATLPPSTQFGGQHVPIPVFEGGAKKSKKNKKQNRRKKMKTRRNKK